MTHPDAERLALAFVECTTEFDYAPLPDAIKSKLIEAATMMLVHADPVIVRVDRIVHRLEA